MSGFLSGFSQNYTGGVQAGSGYGGKLSGAGGASGMPGTGGGREVDVTQLKEGDTFQGQIASVNGEDVQIQLTNGQFMLAKLARDVQVAIGQTMTLQVQSNKDNHVVLKPVYDGNAQMMRVGEAALRAAGMAVNGKNLNLVSSLLENGMSIDKNTLTAYNRMSIQNPQVEMSDMVRLAKLHLPVTEENVRQLQSYQGMEHKILDGIADAADELAKTYESIAGQGEQAGSLLTAGDKFMAQVLTVLSGESDGAAEAEAAPLEQPQVQENAQALTQTENGETVENMQNGKSSEADAAAINLSSNETETAGIKTAHETLPKSDAQVKESADNHIGNEAENTTQNIARNITQNTASVKTEQAVWTNREAGMAEEKAEAGTSPAPEQTQEGQLKELVGQLRGEALENVPDKVIEYLNGKNADVKDVRQLLFETDIGKSLTPEQRDKIFRSEPFKALLKDGLQKQWTITPEEISKEGRVEDLYQRIMREAGQLSKLINEALGSNAGAAAPQAKAMGNITENVEFINQINQMFTYVQLPIRFGDSQAHGDLYVYTNKRNLAHRDGMLTAFLHLDMDNLGSLDVSIALQTEKNQVTTKFYIDDDSISLVQEHIGELSALLEKRGYNSKNIVLEKEEDKTVLEHIEEQVAAGNTVLGYRTFDTRA
ncbi:MAG: hypothetical protein LUE96_11085 [Lachnospiraceae bacterium]|nr:hypothetical protein [Lachnospiraceae bacterium]